MGCRVPSLRQLGSASLHLAESRTCVPDCCHGKHAARRSPLVDMGIFFGLEECVEEAWQSGTIALPLITFRPGPGTKAKVCISTNWYKLIDLKSEPPGSLQEADGSCIRRRKAITEAVFKQKLLTPPTWLQTNEGQRQGFELTQNQRQVSRFVSQVMRRMARGKSAIIRD